MRESFGESTHLTISLILQVEKAPWWYVNLLEPYMVQLVRIDFGQSCCGKFSHLYKIKNKNQRNKSLLLTLGTCNTLVVEIAIFSGRKMVVTFFSGPPFVAVSYKICFAWRSTDLRKKKFNVCVAKFVISQNIHCCKRFAFGFEEKQDKQVPLL
jgi:hypothetical protein